MLGPLTLVLLLSGPSQPAAPPALAPLALQLDGGAAGLHARIVRDDVSRPWRATEWLFVRSGGGSLNLARPQLTEQGVALPTPPQAGGLVLCGLDLPARVETLPAARWSAFLEQLGLPASELQGPQRVRRIESAKALWRAEAGAPSSVALAKTGQEVELRPVADPTTLAAFGDLPLRGYALASSAGGALLRARHASSGDLREARLDDQGLGTLRLGLPGRWTITLTVVQRLTDDDAADWLLATATLGFIATGEER